MCIISKRGADRVRRGHLWVYRSDIKDTEGAAPGSVVPVRDERGNVLGKAFYSSKSQIALRFLTRGDVEIDDAFFRKRFVEQIALDATSSLEVSLGDPSREAPPVHFLARLHSDPKRVILSRLWTLAQRCEGELQPSSFEEDFLLLSKQLLILHTEIRAQIARVPASKASTRQELFRRLQTAKEYMHSCVDSRVSLEAVARESCLSPYHLHRSFKQVFRQTPHQYLTGIRLDRAYSLLRDGWKVIDVCIEIGLTSTSSFTRLFRSRFGCSPSEIRKIGQARR